MIAGVTDKNYITNSYHVHVTEQINAFEKLKFESQFQKLSPGGAISYVEVPDMQNNIPMQYLRLCSIYMRILCMQSLILRVITVRNVDTHGRDSDCNR